MVVDGATRHVGMLANIRPLGHDPAGDPELALTGETERAGVRVTQRRISPMAEAEAIVAKDRESAHMVGALRSGRRLANVSTDRYISA